MKSLQNIKILFFGSGPAMPSRNPSYRGRWEALSDYFSGDIVTHASSEELNLRKIGRFNFIPFHYKKGNPVYRNVRFYFKVFRYGLQIIRKNQSHETVIISPDPLGTGLAAILIGKLTKTKVIVEVNGCFDQALTTYLQKGRPVSKMTRIKEKLTRLIVPFVLKKADRVKLLYPEQLKPVVPHPEALKTDPFHVYIPIKSFLEKKSTDDHFILLLGHPWYLKGVDLLIKAFLKISDQFPKHRLVIAGWCPDPEEKQYFVGLTQNHPMIDLLDPFTYEEVISHMTRCSLYVSASRTEAMGRVLVEAMASRKPIVAPNVDGIPNIVHDGYNGLLFQKESVDDLAEKITILLSDNVLARRIAENGYNYCQSNLSETQYIEKYKKLILSVVNE